MEECLVIETNINDASSIKQNNKLNIPIKLNNEFLICPECSSALEIISINEDTDMLEFKCSKNNHKINKISLAKYFSCLKNKSYNLNDFKDKCTIHKNNYICYCLECNQHLCDFCLKSGTHINHRKNIILEIKPTEPELKVIYEVIQNNQIILKNLYKEREFRAKELNLELSKKQLKEKNLLKNKIDFNILTNRVKLEQNEKKYLNQIIEIKKKYEDEAKKAKIKYLRENNKINNELKINNAKAKIKFDLNVKKLDIFYKGKINESKLESKIEKVSNIISLNGIVLNTYTLYNNV